MTGPINISAVRRKHERFVRLLKEATSAAAHEAGQEAVQYVRKQPHFTPRRGMKGLQGKTTYKLIRSRSGRLVRVSNSARYARAIEDGSRPHTITARRKKFLRFVGKGGNVVFRRSVWHPGTKATHFLWRATLQGYEFLGHRLRSEQRRLAAKF